MAADIMEMNDIDSNTHPSDYDTTYGPRLNTTAAASDFMAAAVVDIPTGEITLTFADDPRLGALRTMDLVWQPCLSADGDVGWNCSTTAGPTDYDLLPIQCRNAAPPAACPP
jgi:hypothetical protein